MNKKQLRILVAPLDWGLGHVTRCVPVIKQIIKLGHQVVFAGDTNQQIYIRQNFPLVEMLDLEGYNVQYAKTKTGLLPKIIAQIPRLKRCIKKEHLWLQNIIKSHHIDAVISDNRYGLYSSHVPCILMTHQLQIRSGMSSYFDRVLLKIHYRFIEKFSRCWVVDVPEDDGLSGVLAHPAVFPKIETEYIGLLSQCADLSEKKRKDDDFIVLVLLSGAEPQRTILSEMLWKKAIKSDKHFIYVEGSDTAIQPPVIPDHISYHKRLSEKELVIAIGAASIVICRSGYSSLMDLLAMGKKAILIPTPGQTEQEYLAKLMHEKKIFMSARQQKFDIQTSILNATLFPYRTIQYGDAFELHKAVLEKWLKEVQVHV